MYQLAMGTVYAMYDVMSLLCKHPQAAYRLVEGRSTSVSLCSNGITGGRSGSLLSKQGPFIVYLAFMSRRRALE